MVVRRRHVIVAFVRMYCSECTTSMQHCGRPPSVSVSTDVRSGSPGGRLRLLRPFLIRKHNISLLCRVYFRLDTSLEQRRPLPVTLLPHVFFTSLVLPTVRWINGLERKHGKGKREVVWTCKDKHGGLTGRRMLRIELSVKRKQGRRKRRFMVRGRTCQWLK